MELKSQIRKRKYFPSLHKATSTGKLFKTPEKNPEMAMVGQFVVYVA
jgi:hypothetical protein